MELQEKKYRVESFDDIEKKLAYLGAEKVKDVVSTHYYGHHDGNDVEKFVDYKDRLEVHVLKEINGRFTMMEHRRIPDASSGFAWLKERGYTIADIVKMVYSEYAYKDGTVGLYVIDETCKSVILYYPPNHLGEREKEFGLETREVINVPYNMFLNQLGRLRSIHL